MPNTDSALTPGSLRGMPPMKAFVAFFSLSHWLWLKQQFWDSHQDHNVRRAVLVICALSLAIAVRFASAAGWVVSRPLTHIADERAQTLLRAGDTFWNGSVTPVLMVGLFSVAALLTLLGHLEEWPNLRNAGLLLTTFCWARVAWVAVWQLGWPASLLFCGCGWISASVFLTCYNAERDRRLLLAEAEARRLERIKETESTAYAMGEFVKLVTEHPEVVEQVTGAKVDEPPEVRALRIV